MSQDRREFAHSAVAESLDFHVGQEDRHLVDATREVAKRTSMCKDEAIIVIEDGGSLSVDRFAYSEELDSSGIDARYTALLLALHGGDGAV